MLRLTGRMPPLTQLPLAEALGRRGAPELRRHFAGANKLTNDTVVGMCSNGAGRSLEHAGLSYNRITALPSPAALAGGLPVLISLDLSHNDLCDLGAFLRGVSALPMLRCLWAEGNPLRAELGRMVGRTSVPSVFIGGKYVGGFDGGVSEDQPGILDLAFQGKLRPLLEDAGALK